MDRRLALLLVVLACAGCPSSPADDAGIDAGMDARASGRDADRDAPRRPDAPDPDISFVGSCDAGEAPDASTGEIVRYTETREPCADRSAVRNLYWGDLHVHTRNSFDSWAAGNETTPDDAYRFARGEEVEIYGDPSPRRVRLTRPLDFAAVTDHSEFLGEVDICREPGAPGYDSRTCRTYRERGRDATVVVGVRLASASPSRDRAVCGEDLEDCRAHARTVWEDVQAIAERHYDRSAGCGFTTFVAYEYTLNPGVNNLHRNVIFRNEHVPELPVSVFEAPVPEELWQALEATCTTCGGCEALTIPHNGNQSAGRMYSLSELDGLDESASAAMLARRHRYEPLVEIVQHKGASECRPELSFGLADEQCDFELVRSGLAGAAGISPELPPCNGDGTGVGSTCWSRDDYIRHAMSRGLEMERAHGVNPIEQGFVGSTDTHNGTSGRVDEESFGGHLAMADAAPLTLLDNGPGGLAAVWAVENSRDAIFEALQRRETYATSGTRIALRVFASTTHAWDDALCGDPTLLARGYDEGVPMGGNLAATAAPSFVVQAMADVVPIGLVQVVKVWVDATGRHERVFDVASPGARDADVDLDTCTPRGTGAMELCATWTDPEWSADQSAAYYVRVLENPSCRWTGWQCSRMAAADRPEACSSPEVPLTLRERAWSSPIWVR
ncbi:MAG: DUF3604 domain-containing protein [Sandaracinus sp.]